MHFPALLFVILLSIASPVNAAFAPVNGKDLLTGAPVAREAGKKGLVVLFLSAECPCSDDHTGEAKALAAEFPEFNFVAVHSNQNEKREESLAYFRDKNFPFPVVEDTDAKLADEFRALKTPHAFVVGTDGKIAYRGGISDSKNFGKADRKYLREALEDLNAGRAVRTSEARTLGCVISRRKS